MLVSCVLLFKGEMDELFKVVCLIMSVKTGVAICRGDSIAVFPV